MEGSKFTIGQNGQNDRGQEQELGKGKNLLRRDTASEVLENGLELQQQQARYAYCGSNPKVTVIDECADQVSCQARHFRGDTGSSGTGKLMPVGNQKESGDYQEPERDRDQLRPGKKGAQTRDTPY